MELEKIQDITIDVDGPIETFIGYGTISLQTAGEVREFILDDAAYPEQAKQMILEAQKTVRELNMQKQGQYIVAELGE